MLQVDEKGKDKKEGRKEEKEEKDSTEKGEKSKTQVKTKQKKLGQTVHRSKVIKERDEQTNRKYIEREKNI